MTESCPAHLAVPAGRLCGRREHLSGQEFILMNFEAFTAGEGGPPRPTPRGSWMGKGVPLRKLGKTKVLERRAKVRRSDPRAGCPQGLPARYAEGDALCQGSGPGCGPSAPRTQANLMGQERPAPGWDCRVRDPHCRCTRSARGPGPALSGMLWGGGRLNPHRLFKCVLPPFRR